jgi:hypothetical protein
MIWFTCKKCGKKHGRADNLSGTLVFCDCGQGNPVPWQSTTSPPEAPPEPPRRPAPPPPPRPRPFDDRDRDRDRPPLPPPLDDPREGDLLRRRKSNVFRRRRPGFCLNHDDVATDKTCADCKEPFCPNCLIELQGQTLCGPCKNFRIRGLNRPARVPGMAVVAMVVGLVSGPVSFCLTLVGNGQAGGVALTVLMSMVGLVLPVGGLVVSWIALREIETKPNLGGRGLAMTGATSSLVGALWCLTVACLVILKTAQG